MTRFTDDQVAQVVHAANIAVQAVLGDDMPSLPWAWEPRSARRITMAGVARVRRAGMTARETHQLWLNDKRNAGWTLGPLKDPERKTHPDLLDWDDLPPEARMKAELLVVMTHALSREL